MNFSLIRRPSAWFPILLSVAALTLVILHWAIYGAVREADEGTPAHVFQLLMLAQLPLIAFFAIGWLPRLPRQAAMILAMQFAAAMAAVASVRFLVHAW